MTRQRSPNYPAIPLGDAIELIGRLFAREKRVVVPEDIAAKALGYGGLNGAVRGKLSALRKYGLVDDRRDGYKVSDLAITILHPTSPKERQAAVDEAALRPALFRELLPFADASDDTLVSTLVRRGFSIAGARQAAEAFRQTLSLLSGAVSDVSGGSANKEDSENQLDEQLSSERAQHGRPTDGVLEYRFPLSAGKFVEIRIVGGPLVEADVRLIGRYLDLVATTLPSPESSDDSEVE